MNAVSILVIVVCALALLALASYLFFRRKHSKELRQQFGQEYERVVEETGSRGKAEKALEERRERVEKLRIVPLSGEARELYAERWRRTQDRFLDEPLAAVSDADKLVDEVMAARGYPTRDFDQRLADISVEHSELVEAYRAARTVRMQAETDSASTEDLRLAMQNYKALFEDLLEMPVATA